MDNKRLRSSLSSVERSIPNKRKKVRLTKQKPSKDKVNNNNKSQDDESFCMSILSIESNLPKILPILDRISISLYVPDSSSQLEINKTSYLSGNEEQANYNFSQDNPLTQSYFHNIQNNIFIQIIIFI